MSGSFERAVQSLKAAPTSLQCLCAVQAVVNLLSAQEHVNLATSGGISQFTAVAVDSIANTSTTTAVRDTWIAIIHRLMLRGSEHTSIAHFAPRLADIVKAQVKDKYTVPDYSSNALRLLSCVLAYSTVDTGLGISNLPHPQKTPQVLPRVYALELLPWIVQTSRKISSVNQEVLAYLRKAMEGTCFPVREAAVEAVVALCRLRAAIDDDVLPLLIDVLHKVCIDASYTSPKLQANLGAALGGVLSVAALGSSNALQHGGGASQLTSYWGLWKGGAAGSGSAVPAGGVGTGGGIGTSLSAVKKLFRSPMTRSVQSLLGDALGFLLTAISDTRGTFGDALDQAMLLLVPTADDDRVYGPKLMARALRRFAEDCGSEQLRVALVTQLMAYVSASVSKNLSHAALLSIAAVLPSLVSLNEIGHHLFLAVRQFTSAVPALSGVCCEVIALTLVNSPSCENSVFSSFATAVEDMTDETVPGSFFGLARIVLLVPPSFFAQRHYETLVAAVIALGAESPRTDETRLRRVDMCEQLALLLATSYNKRISRALSR